MSRVPWERSDYVGQGVHFGGFWHPLYGGHTWWRDAGFDGMYAVGMDAARSPDPGSEVEMKELRRGKETPAETVASEETEPLVGVESKQEQHGKPGLWQRFKEMITPKGTIYSMAFPIAEMEVGRARSEEERIRAEIKLEKLNVQYYTEREEMFSKSRETEEAQYAQHERLAHERLLQEAEERYAQLQEQRR
jgi:hypothetical protein